MSSRKNDIEVSVHCRLVILFFSRFFFFFFLALCLRFVFWCKQYPLVDDLLYSRYLRAWHILNSGIHVPYVVQFAPKIVSVFFFKFFVKCELCALHESNMWYITSATILTYIILKVKQSSTVSICMQILKNAVLRWRKSFFCFVKARYCLFSLRVGFFKIAFIYGHRVS